MWCMNGKTYVCDVYMRCMRCICIWKIYERYEQDACWCYACIKGYRNDECIWKVSDKYIWTIYVWVEYMTCMAMHVHMTRWDKWLYDIWLYEIADTVCVYIYGLLCNAWMKHEGN